jgi:RNA polymerase sigma-70 factor, ECF subfamily
VTAVSYPVADASSDADLVRRAQAGDDHAIRAIYARHARYLAGVVYRIMGADHELDDIVQETFLDGLDGLDSLTNPDALRGWLATIAVRRVHRVLSRRRRRKTLLALFHRLSPTSSDPRTGEAASDLCDLLEQLSPDLRIPWVLARLEDWTLPEVAKTCDVSLATVKRRIADAEARLARRQGSSS